MQQTHKLLIIHLIVPPTDIIQSKISEVLLAVLSDCLSESDRVKVWSGWAGSWVCGNGGQVKACHDLYFAAVIKTKLQPTHDMGLLCRKKQLFKFGCQF